MGARSMSAGRGITITPIRVGELAAVRMPIHVYCIDHPDGRILVDTGFTELHPAVADMQPNIHPLNRQDFDLGGVRMVMNTHLHFDHCGGNHLFPDVPLYVQRQELEDARAQPDYTIPEWVDPPNRPLRYVTVEGDQELLPGILAVSTPGHTRGSQAIVVDAHDGLVVIAGDAAVWSGELDDPKTEGQRRIVSLRPKRVWLSHQTEPWTPG